MSGHNHNKHHPFFQAVTFAALASATVIAVPAWANPPQLIRFEACAQQVIASEKTKEAPDTRRVIGACSAEFDALIAALPPGSREGLAHHIDHRAEQLLVTERK